VEGAAAGVEFWISFPLCSCSLIFHIAPREQRVKKPHGSYPNQSPGEWGAQWALSVLCRCAHGDHGARKRWHGGSWGLAPWVTRCWGPLSGCWSSWTRLNALRLADAGVLPSGHRHSGQAVNAVLCQRWQLELGCSRWETPATCDF
jgi:hypothetical protein